MKRILQFLIIALMAFVWLPYASADSRTYYLYLGKTDSGNTTVAHSGVSTLIVQGYGIQRKDSVTDLTGLENLKDGTAMFQITALEVSQAAQGKGGDNSGATIWVRYRERIDSGVTWSLTSPISVVSGFAISGASMYQIPIYPELMGEQRWEFCTSGPTAFNNAIFKIRYLD